MTEKVTDLFTTPKIVLDGWWLFCLAKFFGVPRFMFDLSLLATHRTKPPSRQVQLVHSGVERSSSTISLNKNCSFKLADGNQIGQL